MLPYRWEDNVMRWMFLIVAMLEAGCLTRPIPASEWMTTYTKPELTREALEADAIDCHWNAPGERLPRGHSILVAGWAGIHGAPTPAAHADCMRAKGYRVLTP